jgi:hypothetical protein
MTLSSTLTSAQLIEKIKQADPSGEMPVAYLLSPVSSPRPVSAASVERDDDGDTYVMVG